MAKRKVQKDIDYDILQIDSDDLLAEWLKQPDLMGEYTRELADAKRHHNRAKAKFKLVCAELNLDIRKSPDTYGLAKITEDGITNAMIREDEYQESQTNVIEAEYRVDLLDGLVKSLLDKRKALEASVSLFGMDYFSEPRASKEVKEAMDEVEKRRIRSKGRMKKKWRENDDE